MPDSTQDAIARIIDPDAFHDGLPTDGCGAYWMGRRNKAKSKASEILTLPAAALATKDAEIAAAREALATLKRAMRRLPGVSMALGEQMDDLGAALGAKP